MKNLFLFFVLIFILPFGKLSAQNETKQIENIVNQLFLKMRKADTTDLRTLFTKEATLFSAPKMEKQSSRISYRNSADAFIRTLAKAKPKQLVEKTNAISVAVDGNLATATMNYDFYLDQEFSHCGKNYFTFVKLENGWKIASIADTRYKEKCPLRKDALANKLDTLMNNWHYAATTANHEAFFGFLETDGIYIGTDATERWTQQEMSEWAAPYFERDTAWAFTTVERNFDFTDDLQLAWFDELLDTWMGTCRASGVLRKNNEGHWELAHYHLSIAVPNEKIKAYLEVLKD